MGTYFVLNPGQGAGEDRASLLRAVEGALAAGGYRSPNETSGRYDISWADPKTVGFLRRIPGVSVVEERTHPEGPDKEDF